MNIHRIFSQVISKNLPDEKNRKAVDAFIASLNVLLKKNGISAHALLGGSVAKGTHLSLYDCDIFVVFEKNYDSGQISSLLGSVIPSARKVHGSRDYFQIMRGGVLFELIPVLKIEKAVHAQNVTDVSPLHVQWVNQHIGALQNDVRLAKLFCKALGVYGAESYINGFSGYILEILVIAYGGFLPMLKAAAGFRPKQIIDIMNYYKTREDLLKDVNKAKLQSPLIVIDPVQKNRNAAAALSEDKFSRFVFGARLFLQKPSASHFFRKRFAPLNIKKRAHRLKVHLVLLKAVPIPGKSDVVGSKLIKLFEYLTKRMGAFGILEKGWHWNEDSYFWYFLTAKELAPYELHEGPVLYGSWENISRFIKKHKSFIVENNKLSTLRRREYNTPEKLIACMKKDPYVADKVKKMVLL